MDWKLDYPEIDTQTFTGADFQLRWHSDSRVETIVDVLDVYQEAESDCTAVLKEGLDHQALVNYIQAAQKPRLRILFVAASPSGPYLLDPIPALSPATAKYLINKLGVSPVFIASITTDPWLLKSGNGSFHKRDEKANLSITGFYRYACGFREQSTFSSNIWFSHEVNNSGTSLYFSRNCPPVIKDNILRTARSSLAPSLLRPLAVDALIATEAVSAWGEEHLNLRNRLIEYEHKDVNQTRPYLNEYVQDLHTLSQEFHILQEDLVDLTERLEYLIRIHKSVCSRSRRRGNNSTSTSDSLSYLLSKATIMRRWAQNYTNRTSIRINLLFNLSSQWDNQTNLQVAGFSSKIATIAQRDSSSMLTMSAVTMLFLPGAFVSALFSMVFFNTTTNADGRVHLSVSPQWWLFPAVAVPLTVLVFVLWNTLRRQRPHIRLAQRPDVLEDMSGARVSDQTSILTQEKDL